MTTWNRNSKGQVFPSMQILGTERRLAFQFASNSFRKIATLINILSASVKYLTLIFILFLQNTAFTQGNLEDFFDKKIGSKGVEEIFTYSSINDFNSANLDSILVYLERLLTEMTNPEESSSRLLVYYFQSQCYLAIEDYQKALTSAKSASKEFRESKLFPNSKIELKLDLILAQANFFLKEFKTSEKYIDQCLERESEFKMGMDKFLVLKFAGYSRFYSGLTESAISYWEKASSIRSKIGDIPEIEKALALKLIADSYSKLEQYQAASEYNFGAFFTGGKSNFYLYHKAMLDFEIALVKSIGGSPVFINETDSISNFLDSLLIHGFNFLQSRYACERVRLQLEKHDFRFVPFYPLAIVQVDQLGKLECEKSKDKYYYFIYLNVLRGFAKRMGIQSRFKEIVFRIDSIPELLESLENQQQISYLKYLCYKVDGEKEKENFYLNQSLILRDSLSANPALQMDFTNTLEVAEAPISSEMFIGHVTENIKLRKRRASWVYFTSSVLPIIGIISLVCVGIGLIVYKERMVEREKTELEEDNTSMSKRIEILKQSTVIIDDVDRIRILANKPLIFTKNKKVNSVKYRDVFCIISSARRNYCTIYYSEDGKSSSFEIRKTITKLEQQLPKALFAKVNRSIIVNFHAIERENGREIILKNHPEKLKIEISGPCLEEFLYRKKELYHPF